MKSIMTHLAPPGQTTTVSVEQALGQAVAHHRQGQLQDAERLYRTIIQAQPRHPEANHNLGVLAVQVKQPSVGLPFLKTALETNPNQGQYWLSYLDALLQAGQTDAARQLLAQGRQRGLQGEAVDALAGRLAGGAQAAGQPDQHALPDAPPSPSVDPPHHKKQPKVKSASRSASAKESTPSPQEINTLVALFVGGRCAEAATHAQQLTRRFPRHGFGWKILGAVLRQMGRNAEALAAMQNAAILSPNDAEAYNNLSITLKELGRLTEAEAGYRRALRIKPDFAEAHYNLGITFQELGRQEEAEASFRRALQIKPDYAAAHNNLGNTLQEVGRPDEAEVSFRRALAIRPDFAAAHNNLGNTLQKVGRPDEAEVSLCRALAIKPDFAEAYNNLGVAWHELGRLQEAEASIRRALAIKPDFAEAYNNLSNTLKEMGQLQEAEASSRRALAIRPDFAEAYNNLGNTLNELCRLAEAEASYRRALQIKADFADAHNNLGVSLHDQCRLAEAEASYRRALQIKPDFAEAHNNLGSNLKEMGRLNEAEASYRRALESKADFAGAHSNLLLLLNYASHNLPADCLEEARQYGRKADNTVTSRFTEWPCADQPGPLRVGFVSGDLRNHPVGYFLENLLTWLARSSVELVAYPTHHRTDELTERIKPCFTAWKPLVGHSDEAAAQMIHRDGVQVLIDLSGHTCSNRLPIFAWKPAPVQVSWLGYFATTGVAAIDYLVADPWVVPASEEMYFTEKILRLPETRLCFTPPEIDMEVAPLPALTNGYVTFGCFNNLAKMNDDVVALWSRVLGAVPGSRLFLKAKQLREATVRDDTCARFAVHGVVADRLILEGSEPRAQYLRAYQRVDIALDPFPYPGGTTSVEALWMGVPLLTLAGEGFLSRQGVGLLMNAGLSDWVAGGPDHYVARAVSHASDLQCLAILRNGLRQQVLTAPIFDARRFARHFETALRDIWQQWCGRQQGQS